MPLFNKKSSPRSSKKQSKQTFVYYRGGQKASTTEAEYKKNNTQPRSKKLIITHIANGMIIVALVLFAGYLSMLTTTPKIEVTDNSVLINDLQTYQQSIGEVMSGSLLNRSKFTINTKNIASTIKKKHPEISNVTVVVPFFFRQPKVVLTPVKPAFLANSDNMTFLVDEFGVAVGRVQDLKKIEQLDLVGVNDEAGIDLEQGKAVFSQEHTNFIREVIYQLNKAGNKVTTISLPVSAFDISVQIKDKPYFVKMNLEGDARAQSGRYLVAEKDLERAKREPREYIDVRVDDRAFIK